MLKSRKKSEIKPKLQTEAQRRYHSRPPSRPKLYELIELRLRKYPDMMQRDFATKVLGVSRLHMTSIEVGRRAPSLDLAVRWIAALAPEARLSMFGPLPETLKHIRIAKRVREIDPELYEAA